jgi:hypothetical protein
MVAFFEVPFNLKQFFHGGVPYANFFLDVALIFLRPAPLYMKKARQ